MKKKPIIGIIGKTDRDKKSEVGIDYVNAIEKSGGVPFLLPYMEDSLAIEQAVKFCDGFLFTGGVDIDPDYYNEKTLNDTVCVCKERDAFDFAVIKEVLRTNKPVLAICRGIQLLNVALGGSLIQDIPSQSITSIRHKQSEGRYEFSHFVKVEKCSPLFGIVGKTDLRVNSFHHQAIKNLGRGLYVTATSADGIAEAVAGEGKRFVRGYQWHPELLFTKDSVSKKLFEEFMLACVKE